MYPNNPFLGFILGAHFICYFSSSKSRSSSSSTTTTTNKDNSVAQGTGGKVATDGGTLADTIAEENSVLTQVGAADSGFIVSDFSGDLTVETTDDELALAVVSASENLANRAVDSGQLAFDNALRATQQAGEVAQNAFDFATNDESQLAKWAIIGGAIIGTVYLINR